MFSVRLFPSISILTCALAATVWPAHVLAADDYRADVIIRNDTDATIHVMGNEESGELGLRSVARFNGFVLQ